MKSKEMEAVEEVLFQEALNLSELDALALKDEQLKALKALLPMLYTSRGNMVKVGNLRITGKNFNALNERILTLKMKRGSELMVNGEGWSLIIKPQLADQLRDFNQIEMLVLNGWQIELI